MLLEHVTSVPHLRKHCSVQALAEREKGIGGDTLESLRSCLYRVSSKGLPNAVSGCLWTTPMPERESEDGEDDCQGQGWGSWGIGHRIRLGESQFKNTEPDQVLTSFLLICLNSSSLAFLPVGSPWLVPPFPQFDSSSSFHSTARVIFVKGKLFLHGLKVFSVIYPDKIQTRPQRL